MSAFAVVGIAGEDLPVTSRHSHEMRFFNARQALADQRWKATPGPGPQRSLRINLAGEIDGIEAARRIRERRNVPIIFVTAYASDDATVSRIVAALGPSVIVGKPAPPAAVRQAILKLREK